MIIFLKTNQSETKQKLSKITKQYNPYICLFSELKPEINKQIKIYGESVKNSNNIQYYYIKL